METTKLSTKGQIILPKRIRESRSWVPGSEFIVEEAADGILLRPAGRFPPTTLDEVAGSVHYRGRKKSLDQMQAAIDREVKRRRARRRY
jgi:AbrB family looped-hinge helix DNA binding protein